MKRFDTFGEYMFDLLFGPLKKAQRARNQFAIFFRVIGRHFDDVKRAFFRVREEADVVSCSEVMLPVHGADRDMPRLPGETAEAYRARLSMKGLISAWGGTRQGVLYALAALGYEQSYIEPFSLQDPERWAEFIVFLKGSKQSGVNNLAVIDTEVRKVKEGSSKPSYGMEAGNVIVLGSRLSPGLSDYPLCGLLVCGVWPEPVSTGHLLASFVEGTGGASSGDVEFPLLGTLAASKTCYSRGGYVDYTAFASGIETASWADGGVKEYLVCSEATYCSPETNMRKE